MCIRDRIKDTYSKKDILPIILEGIKSISKSNDIDVVIFDCELTPNQQTELRTIFQCDVVDRTGLILDIFSLHAQSKEASLQVELAMSVYLKPRLAGLGKTLNQQGGGIGTRGPGETKLETDSRLIVNRINKLKKEKNAVILAHNYQTPEIYHGVSDIAADSLALAVEAAKTSADIIVLCGVHFMAETAKLMSPEKKVLIPDMNAGCSLAASLTGEDVRLLKKQYPGVPVVSYVNTSADVKAETDVCCTSANAVKIVNSLGVRKVIFLPDDYLAKYVASQTDVEIISWKGTCEVHEKFNDTEINEIRKNNPGIKVIAHPECPPDVINASDFTGSTSGMIKYVKDNQPEKVMMVTECSMSDNVQVDNPVSYTHLTLPTIYSV